MANKLYNEDNIQDIANAVREKNGKTDKYKVSELGNAVRAIEGGGNVDIPFVFSGVNATKVYEHIENFSLEDTTYQLGTLNSSQTRIKDAISKFHIAPTITVENKDIIIVQTLYAKPTYNGSETNKSKQLANAYTSIYNITTRKADEINKSQRQNKEITSYLMKYYNSSGNLKIDLSNYGFYGTIQSNISSSYSNASNSVTFSFDSPPLYNRYNSSYMSSGNTQKVIECYFEWKIEIYTVKDYSTLFGEMNTLMENMLIDGWQD